VIFRRPSLPLSEEQRTPFHGKVGPGGPHPPGHAGVDLIGGPDPHYPEEYHGPGRGRVALLRRWDKNPSAPPAGGRP